MNPTNYGPEVRVRTEHASLHRRWPPHASGDTEMHSIIAFLFGILVGAVLMLVVVTAIFDFQNREQ